MLPGIWTGCGIQQQVRRLCVTPGRTFVLYGDPAYPVSDILIAPYPSSNQELHARAFNRSMSAVRQAVEWGFAKVIQQFAFVDFSKNQKCELQDVGGMYNAAVLLTNCHTCLYGSQTNQYFGITPPTLEQYLSWFYRERQFPSATFFQLHGLKRLTTFLYISLHPFFVFLPHTWEIFEALPHRLLSSCDELLLCSHINKQLSVLANCLIPTRIVYWNHHSASETRLRIPLRTAEPSNVFIVNFSMVKRRFENSLFTVVQAGKWLLGKKMRSEKWK